MTTSQGRRFFYAKTQREALAKLKAAQKQLDAGHPLPDGRLTLGDYLDRWLAEAVKPHLSYKAHQGYECQTRVHLKPALGERKLAKLTPLDVQQLVNAKLASGLSRRSVEYMLATLRRALNQAVAWGLLPSNPAAGAILPKRTAPQIAALTPAQARSLLDGLKGDRLEALYLLTATLGLRQAEALGLRWHDVDFASRTVRVEQTLQRQKRPDGKPYWVFVPPKTDKSRRTLPLPDRLAAALKAHRARQNEERLAAGDWEDWGLVFCSTRGTPLDGNNVTHRFQRLVAPLGLPHLRFHDLRHCCASLGTALGLPDRVVMELLGHTSVGMTARYQHVPTEVLRAAADALDEALHTGTDERD